MTLLRCQWCPKAFPTSRALNNHYSHQSSCGSKRMVQYEARLVKARIDFFRERRPTKGVQTPHLPRPRRWPDASTAADTTNLRPQYLDPGPSAQFGDERDSAQTNAQHPDLMEDVQYDQDQPVEQEEQSDCQDKDYKENCDEHPLDPPFDAHLGPLPSDPPPQILPSPQPHPPHKSIYEESHPDATAGGVLRWRRIDRKGKGKAVYDPMWSNDRLFRHAEWLGNATVSNRKRDEYLRLHHEELPWTRAAEFLRDVDQLPHGPQWKREVIYDPNNQLVDLWTRDPIEVIESLMSNPQFARYMRYAPVRHWTSSEQKTRLFSEVWTGNRWWRLQNALGSGRGATVAMVILSSDKTQLSLMRGNQQAWPVYLTLGNISNTIRRRPSAHAQVLLGYIPVTDIHAEAGWQFYHNCMKVLLNGLKEAGERGVEMDCADGGVRLVFPIVSAFVGDWPEQCLVACVRQNRCPICTTPTAGRGNCDCQYDRRNKSDFLTNLGKGKHRVLKKLGYRPTWPFWEGLPLVDISCAITPDLLHQVNKGVFLHHLVKWMTQKIGVPQFDQWLTGIPRTSRLRHFTKGKSMISRWTGAEAKSLAQVFMSVASGCNDSNAVAASKHLLAFIHLAHMSQLSDNDLDALDHELELFHELKQVFIKCGKNDEVDFDNIPKLHMLSHYTSAIRDLGSTDNFNTEATERLHIEYVKDGWRASNKVEPLGQMTVYLQRREAWVLLRAHLIDIGVLPDNNSLDGAHDAPMGDVFSGEDGVDVGTSLQGADGGAFEVVRPNQSKKGKGRLINQALGVGRQSGSGRAETRPEWDSNLIWHPKPLVSTANDRSHVKRTGDDLITRYGATSLISATRRFITDRTGSRSGRPLDENDIFPVWHRCKLEHGRLPFLPADGPRVDIIRATPELCDEYNRVTRNAAFDTALFETNPEAQGIHRYSAGRVRAIFKLPRHLQFIYSKKLVYIEHFQSFSAKPGDSHGLYSTSHDMTSGQVRFASVMPLYRLQMACHLTPNYQSLRPGHSVSSDEDLLETCKIFHLNRYCTHFMFAVLWHWEHRLSSG